MSKLNRILLHIPVGLAAAFLAYQSPVLCAAVSFAFVSYEIIQEVREPNKGWQDISGFIWGAVLGGLIWWIWVSV